MSVKIVQLYEEVIKGQIKELVCGCVEETLNELLEVEAENLTQAAHYERNEPTRAIAAVAMTETLPPPPATSRSMCRTSRVVPLRLLLGDNYVCYCWIFHLFGLIKRGVRASILQYLSMKGACFTATRGDRNASVAQK